MCIRDRSYIYNLKNSIEEPNMAEKLSSDDKASLDDMIKTTISWLDNNQEASTSEYTDKQKEVEEVSRPIMMKLYSDSNSGTGNTQDGPTVEEVD
jgi:heat shock protein 1/8